MTTGIVRVRLPESNRVRERNRAGALASVLLHAALILLAVYATARGASAPDEPAPTPTRIVYQVRPAAAPVAAPAAAARGASPAARPATAAPPAAPRITPSALPAFDVALPDVSVPGPAHGVDARDFGGASTGLALGTGGTGGGLTVGAPLGAHLVDVPARALAQTVPAYPALLRSAGTEGAVVARYVVDSAGRVERGSVVVLETSHPLFADAVRRALERARFQPARVGGRPVAQLVEQRFEFRLER